MKKSFQTTFLLLFVILNINAQSTERFIRIIGNAKKEVNATKAKVYLTISETKENKHLKIEEKSYSDVYSEFISKLTEIEINEKDLNKSFKKLNTHNRIESKKFFIETNFSSLEKILSIKLNGIKISDIKYLYLLENEKIESELSFKAIQDAKRKAKAICDEINMKVGKILNIEVKPSDLSYTLKESKEDSVFTTYKVSITFKLID